jgi:hypothetical protein
VSAAVKFDPHWLRDRFLSGLERRVGRLNDLLAEERYQEAGLLFHSLAGIGGTYGFPAVTTLALEAERICGRAVTTDRAARLQAIVDVLAVTG